MTERRTPAEVLDRARRHVGSWSSGMQQAHGFDLLFGDDENLNRPRRAHARQVLVGRHLLRDQIEAHSGPIVLMKGLEVAMLYPSPTQRPFRDLDVLVEDPRVRWDRLVQRGFRSNPTRRLDIDHHHLPALEDTTGTLGVEFHHRPNVPLWASIPTEFVIDTAEPSRTGIDGVLRPRDDVHALLMAMHCWEGGFTRLRDLFDALLLAASGEASGKVPVEATAASLGLRRFWRVTERLAESQVLGEPARRVPLQRWIVPTKPGIDQRTKSRLIAPYTVCNPLKVTAAHARALRLSRDARRGTTSR